LRTGFSLIARGEFSIVIAGLAVAGDAHADFGPLATAYVLALAVIGPVAMRYADDVMALVGRRASVAAGGRRHGARTTGAG
jgi:CPA2 family monovalent cation:H+ antiporter-2